MKITLGPSDLSPRSEGKEAKDVEIEDVGSHAFHTIRLCDECVYEDETGSKVIKSRCGETKMKSRLLNITPEEQVILDDMKEEIKARGAAIPTDWYLIGIIRGKIEK